MIELQKRIVEVLKLIYPRVYLERAPQGALFPYIVYKFPTSDDTEWREDFILEIDIWDQPSDGSTVNLQTLADKVDLTFNRSRYISQDGKWITRIYRINRLMVPDPDETIRRRQLRYECRTYAS